MQQGPAAALRTVNVKPLFMLPNQHDVITNFRSRKPCKLRQLCTMTTCSPSCAKTATRLSAAPFSSLPSGHCASSSGRPMTPTSASANRYSSTKDSSSSICTFQAEARFTLFCLQTRPSANESLSPVSLTVISLSGALAGNKCKTSQNQTRSPRRREVPEPCRSPLRAQAQISSAAAGSNSCECQCCQCWASGAVSATRCTYCISCSGKHCEKHATGG